jgi:hypothetical protein
MCNSGMNTVVYNVYLMNTTFLSYWINQAKQEKPKSLLNSANAKKTDADKIPINKK